MAEYHKEKDPTFFRMWLPDIDNIEDNNTEKWRIAMNITKQYKCGKVVVISGRLWMSVESFLFGNVDAPNLFSNMILVLRDMIYEYRNDIKQQHRRK
ncbi:hypothetical protein [Prevotellamassilia timonensis]|uniref:hypothetical protein n=1 Tax=Prevotellamassilia timonensis TaxID=1852370 RepID=UPI001F3B5CA4|nr:hypothetical protein [Prevotellamassilia timonensis]MCF2634082.1 hypothetical protein [Prevotellamassilia timonensis]